MGERTSKAQAKASEASKANKAYADDIDMTETDQERSQSPIKSRSKGQRIKAERDSRGQAPANKNARQPKNDSKRYDLDDSDVIDTSKAAV